MKIFSKLQRIPFHCQLKSATGQSSPRADWQTATPGYREAAGLQLVAGRWINEGDRSNVEGAVVISETTAATYWPNEDPLGRRFELGGGAGPGWVTIVGIVRDVTHSGLEAEATGHRGAAGRHRQVGSGNIFHRGDGVRALQALALSFLDTSLPFEFGVYHAFSTLSGDELNQLFQPAAGPRLRLHPVIRADVELKADGTPDDRFGRKVRKITSNAYQGLCNGVPADAPDWPPDPTFKENSTQECDVAATLYNSTTAPIAIMKNEELILLRAEANIGLGNLAAAEADINFVRTNSGLLDPVVLTAANALDRLLYEKHFSLLYEGGHRWIDLRRYNMLNILPLDKVGHQVNAAYPIPIDETAAGGG